MFTNDELIDKFHQFLHGLIFAAIDVIKHITDDLCSDEVNSVEYKNEARTWTLEAKETLRVALTKIFALNLRLYITYKHLLYSHGRYSKLKECSCAQLSGDSVGLFQAYCQPSIVANQRNQVNHLLCSLFEHFRDGQLIDSF